MSESSERRTPVEPLASVNASLSVPTQTEWAELHPKLYEVLAPKVRDGKFTRQGGRLTIFPAGSYWRVTIALPTEAVEGTVLFDDLENILDLLEDMIANHKIHWTPDFQRRKSNSPRVD